MSGVTELLLAFIFAVNVAMLLMIIHVYAYFRVMQNQLMSISAWFEVHHDELTKWSAERECKRMLEQITKGESR